MTRRVLIGRRSSGVNGLWVSKVGFDADTATDAQLLLGITQFTEQLIMIGATSSLPATIPFGFVNPPFVLLTSTNLSISVATSSSDGGHTSNFTGVSGMFIRPYPSIGSPNNAVQAAVSTASMIITCPGGGTTVATYMVYRRRVG